MLYRCQMAVVSHGMIIILFSSPSPTFLLPSIALSHAHASSSFSSALRGTSDEMTTLHSVSSFFPFTSPLCLIFAVLGWQIASTGSCLSYHWLYSFLCDSSEMGKCELCDAKTKGSSMLCVDCMLLREEIKARGRDAVLQTVRMNASPEDGPSRDSRLSFSSPAVECC